MKFALSLKIGDAVDGEAPTASAVSAASPSPAVTMGESPGIPEEWWAEAMDVQRRYDAATFTDHELAAKISQWLGGMARAASYFTGMKHEAILVSVREKVGPPVLPQIESLADFGGIGQVVAWDNKDDALPSGSFDEMAQYRTSSPPE